MDLIYEMHKLIQKFVCSVNTMNEAY